MRSNGTSTRWHMPSARKKSRISENFCCACFLRLPRRSSCDNWVTSWSMGAKLTDPWSFERVRRGYFQITFVACKPSCGGASTRVRGEPGYRARRRPKAALAGVQKRTQASAKAGERKQEGGKEGEEEGQGG